MRVLLLSGYDAASHRRWRQQLTDMFADHHWHTLVLPPRFFRWRIRGNALSWLHAPCLRERWDMVIATSMVDLASVRGFHPSLAQTPTLLYMHENQFAFPLSRRQRTATEPRVVNLFSAVAANKVVFNSAWNRDSFLDGVAGFLEQMPDKVPAGLVEDLGRKSRVIPVPIEDYLYIDSPRPLNLDCPHLVWNHRWEYDKGPERLLSFLQALDRRSMAFRLSVVGERFRTCPEAFDRIHRAFGDRIVHWGFIGSRERYDRLLRQADVVLSTALHDFQGLSVLEAMAAGCLPLTPDRLAYREYVPDACRYESHEKNSSAEAEAAANCLARLTEKRPDCWSPEPWRASLLSARYRAVLDEMMPTRKQ
ncbi:MAG: DUF3524 domain-containing protein [Woeseiaceae bacterium]|nr:DUF3524 domain-containing protein [Woeseiaceae bacterium]